MKTATNIHRFNSQDARDREREAERDLELYGISDYDGRSRVALGGGIPTYPAWMDSLDI